MIMVRPVGGRGRRAPYDTVMVRVPEPIKAEVESLIAAYRNSILSNNDSDSNSVQRLTELLNTIKLVDEFIKEIKQEQNLHQRNNRNLVRFRNWLVEKSANTNPGL